MTLVAVPLSAATAEGLLADTARAAAAGADLVEWRVDTCLGLGASATELLAAISASALPVLFTIRHADESGSWTGTAAERLGLLRAADAAGAAFIDLEFAHRADLGEWRPAQARLIFSAHDFVGMGRDLPALIAAMRAAGGLPKVAVTAADAADLALIRRLLVERHGELIALAMGEHGLPSRLLAGVWGSFLTFARLSDHRGSAPGQPTVDELVGRYRIHAQRPDWQVLGVIGSPIAHSLSPHIHNAALAKDGVPAVYVPLRVEDAGAFWAACGGWIHGLSVTIPHKHALLTAVTSVEPLVTAIGAMNTIATVAGVTQGGNTDAAAIIACVEGAAGTLRGKIVLCLGAGGVGRAIAHALASRGAQVVILNRTHARALELAREVGGRAVTQAEALTVAYDVLVNGTAMGMGKPDESPWPAAAHRPGTVVFDTVYTPLTTRLLHDAQAAGARTVPGLDMFILQAAEQYRRFTGREPDVVLMRATALARLSRGA
jgi:3-dehydroquinate dehydratase/shikimate dehydrogenase